MSITRPGGGVSTRRTRRDVGRLLRSSTARGTDPAALLPLTAALLRVGAADELLLAAARHGVTRFLGAALLPQPGLDRALRASLAAAGNRVLRDQLRVIAELPRIARALDGAGVPWLVVKGPVLAQTAYERPDLREYVDLDVLVEPACLGRAIAALEAAGCRVAGDWPLLIRERAGEVTLVSAGGLVVDLHWHLANDWRVRDALTLPSARELLARARPLIVGAVELLTLDEVDTVLHVAVHASTSGGWRLLWLRDLQQALVTCPADPGVVAKRAEEWGAGLLLAAMRERAERVLGVTGPAPPPSSAVAGPVDRAWLRLLRFADCLAPVEQATGAGSLTRIVTNSTRRDGAASVIELRRRSASLVRNTLLHHGRCGGTPSEDRNGAGRDQFLAQLAPES